MDKEKISEVIGFTAAVLTTISFIPQSVTLWTHRSEPAGNVSLLTFKIFCVGVALWLWYGLRIKKPAVIWANFLGLLIALSILVYKLIYR